MRAFLEGREITGLCTGITVEHNLESAGAEAQLTMVCAPMDSSLPRLEPACGQWVTVEQEGRELFSGRVERVSYNAAALELTILAFDPASLLAKNHCYGPYEGKAEAITRQLAAACGLACGEIMAGDGSTLRLDPVYGRTAFRAIRNLYGGRCVTRWQEGKLQLYPVGQSRAVIDSGRLTALTARNTVEEAVNRVEICSEGLPVACFTDQAAVEQYGPRSRSEHLSPAYPTAEAQAWALMRGLSRQARLTITGTSPVMCGQIISLDKPLMGVYGDYLVERVVWSCREGQTFTELGVVSL